MYFFFSGLYSEANVIPYSYLTLFDVIFSHHFTSCLIFNSTCFTIRRHRRTVEVFHASRSEVWIHTPSLATIDAPLRSPGSRVGHVGELLLGIAPVYVQAQASDVFHRLS